MNIPSITEFAQVTTEEDDASGCAALLLLLRSLSTTHVKLRGATTNVWRVRLEGGDARSEGGDARLEGEDAIRSYFSDTGMAQAWVGHFNTSKM